MSEPIKPIAGPDLDALVAEKVMGLVIYDHAWPCGPCPSDGTFEPANNKADPASWQTEKWPVIAMWREPLDGYMAVEPVRHYSTDISAAWQVVEKLRDEYKFVDVQMESRTVVVWLAATGHVTAPTAPLAICLAALKAAGVEIADA